MTETVTVHQAINLVMRDVTKVEKKERNTQQNFSFRGIDATTKALAPALREHGVVVTPTLLEHSFSTVEVGQKRTPMGHVMIKVMYRFYGPAGDYIDSTVLAESMDSGDKACAKAMSVAFRIALLQTFALPTDEVDPDAESYERSPSEASQAAPKPAARPSPAKTKAEPAKPAEAATAVSKLTLEQLTEHAKVARDSRRLNQIWSDAGSSGWLQAETVHPETKEKIIFQDYLFERADAIKSGGGDSGAKESKPAAKA